MFKLISHIQKSTLCYIIHLCLQSEVSFLISDSLLFVFVLPILLWLTCHKCS